MSTLSLAPETAPAAPADRLVEGPRVRPRRPSPVEPSFDFARPVPTLGQDDPAVRVLDTPPVAATSVWVDVEEPVGGLAPVGADHTPVRLTRRGRLTLTLTLLGVVLAAMVAVGGTWATASPTAGEPTPVRVVEVQPGDTLYGIAASVAEPGEVRDMVHQIQELNSLPSATIAEGQKLAVPRG